MICSYAFAVFRQAASDLPEVAEHTFSTIPQFNGLDAGRSAVTIRRLPLLRSSGKPVRRRESRFMSRVCDICGKEAGRGNKLCQRGKAKYLGGNGRKTTGITKRRYYPNLQNIRIQTTEGAAQKKVCVNCIRSNRIQKAVVRAPFTIPGQK